MSTVIGLMTTDNDSLLMNRTDLSQVDPWLDSSLRLYCSVSTLSLLITSSLFLDINYRPPGRWCQTDRNIMNLNYKSTPAVSGVRVIEFRMSDTDIFSRMNL